VDFRFLIADCRVETGIEHRAKSEWSVVRIQEAGDAEIRRHGEKANCYLLSLSSCDK
jgi:hypothetical protein